MQATKILGSTTAALLVVGVSAVPVLAIPGQNAKFTLTQSGLDVVGTWSGSFDLTGLTLIANGSGYDGIGEIVWDKSGPWCSFSTGNTSSSASTDYYSAPFTFNSGLSTGVDQNGLFHYSMNGINTTSGTGDLASIFVGLGLDTILVPTGYTSGQTLNSSATWQGASLGIGGMGLVGGTSVWNYGSNGATVTVEVVTPGGGVPEPGEWAAMGILGAGLTGLVIRKRKKA